MESKLNDPDKILLKNIVEIFDRFNWHEDHESALNDLGFNPFFYLLGGEDEIVYILNNFIIITDYINLEINIYHLIDYHKESRTCELMNFTIEDFNKFKEKLESMKFEYWTNENPNSRTKKLDNAKNLDLFCIKNDSQDLMILFYLDLNNFELFKKIKNIDLMD